MSVKVNAQLNLVLARMSESLRQLVVALAKFGATVRLLGPRMTARQYRAHRRKLAATKRKARRPR